MSSSCSSVPRIVRLPQKVILISVCSIMELERRMVVTGRMLAIFYLCRVVAVERTAN